MARTRHADRYRETICDTLVFAFALFLRAYFFSGPILADDIEEYGLVKSITNHGLTGEGALEYRYLIWAPNVVAAMIFGDSLGVFFAVSWIISSLLAVVALRCALKDGHSLLESTLIGCLVASFPFEVLLGTIRANDLLLELLVAVGLFAFASFRSRPQLLGGILGLLLSLGLLVKVWALYFLPVVAIYLFQERKRTDSSITAITFLATFALCSAACILSWHKLTGLWLPLLSRLPGTFPVPSQHIFSKILEYPQLIFLGSHFGTTLFGVVPYVALVCTLVRFFLPSDALRRLTQLEKACLLSATCFFLALNFVPNHFRIDQYYSATRIFRYLAPLSFPLSYFVASQIVRTLGNFQSRKLFPLVLAINLTTIWDAHQPGQLQFQAVKKTLTWLGENCPPVLLVEAWQSYFYENVYMPDLCPETKVKTAQWTFDAKDYEQWLTQQNITTGAILISGLGSYLHYGCSVCGFRLEHFKQPLPDAWRRAMDFGSGDPFNKQSTVGIWRLERQSNIEELHDCTTDENTALTLRGGIAALDANDLKQAGCIFYHLRGLGRETGETEDAHYYYAIVLFRSEKKRAALEAFEGLIQSYPEGRWKPAAFYHKGLVLKSLGTISPAREALLIAATNPTDDYVAKWARLELERLRRTRPLEFLGDTLHHWMFYQEQ